jgi:hypothetical protein
VKLFKRFTRIGLIAVVIAFAFGAGVALRGWDDDQGTVAGEAASPLGGDRAFRRIRLVRADPGTLRPPAPERSAESPGAPAVAAPAVSAPAAPPPAPAAPPPAPPPAESPAPPDDTDSNSPDPPPETTFDSEG